MKKWISFVAGAIFAFGLIITCGGGTGPGGMGTDASSILGPNPARAAGGVVWEYAVIATNYVLNNTSESGTYSETYLGMPNGVSPPDLSKCKVQGEAVRSACILNIFGADKWEFAGTDHSTYEKAVFKRPK